MAKVLIALISVH